MRKDLAQLVRETCALHVEQFASDPVWAAAAPGRVNLIGDHTDYSGGFALPFAVDLYTVVAASPKSDPGHAIVSSAKGGPVCFSAGAPAAAGSSVSWHEYPRGVLSLAVEQGLVHSGLNISVHSNLPFGSGLSSSASLEMAVATMLEAATGHELDRLQKVRLCQAAETQYAGMPCGILDQYSVCMAEADRLMLLDCGTCSSTSVPVELGEVAFLVCESNVRHELTDGSYAARRRECHEAEAELGRPLRDVRAVADLTIGDETLFRRAKHVVTENARVNDLACALVERRYADAGGLMSESHDSLRDDYSVSCPEVDSLVAIAQSQDGVLGARMTGGGFGGSVIALVDRAAVMALQDRIPTEYAEATGLTTAPSTYTPVAGAHEVSLD